MWNIILGRIHLSIVELFSFELWPFNTVDAVYEDIQHREIFVISAAYAT